MAESRLINRNVIAGRGRTSMRLEPETWDALREICRRESMTLGELVRSVEQGSGAAGRTSAMRVFALQYFRAAAIEEGHRAAGHGRRPDHDQAAPRGTGADVSLSMIAHRH